MEQRRIAGGDGLEPRLLEIKEARRLTAIVAATVASEVLEMNDAGNLNGPSR
jgi:hypothetical protein